MILRWPSIPSRGEQQYSKLLHATETGLSSGRVGLRDSYATLPTYRLDRHIRKADNLSIFRGNTRAAKASDEEIYFSRVRFLKVSDQWCATFLVQAWRYNVLFIPFSAFAVTELIFFLNA